MNRLLTFGWRECFNTSQFFLFDETGITEALSIQVSQLLENTLIYCPDAGNDFLWHIRLLDGKCCLLRFSLLNDTSNGQFLLAYSECQLHIGSRLTILYYFLLPCPVVFSHQWLPVERNIDSLKEGRFPSLVLPFNQHTPTFGEHQINRAQTFEMFSLQTFQRNHYLTSLPASSS